MVESKSNRFKLPAIILDIFLLGLFVLFSPNVVIGLVIAAVMFTLLLVSPLGYVYFIILLFPYESIAVGGAENIKAIRLIILHAILFISWAKHIFMGARIQVPPKTVFIPIVIYFLWGILSMPLSVSPMTALVAFFKQLSLLAIFLLLYNLINSRKDILKTIYFLLIISIPTYIVALYQFLVLQDPRSHGTFGTANTLGIFSVMIVVAALIFIKLKKDAPIAKSFGRIMILFSLITLLFSNSRASMVTLLLFVMLYLVLNRRYKLLAVSGSVVILGIFLVVTNQELYTYLTKAFRLYMGTTGRDLLWSGALAIIGDNFITGVGIGCVDVVYPHYMQITNPITNLYLRNAVELGYIHNGYLQVFAELGLIGLLLFLWINYRFVLYLKDARYSVESPETRAVITIVFAHLLAKLVYIMVESAHPLGPFSNYAIIMLIYIFAIKFTILDKKETGDHNRPPAEIKK